MKNTLFLLTLALFVAFTGCKTTETAQSQPIKDGYQGIYVVKEWEGDNSVLPKNLTGLVFKRKGNSYQIILANINLKQKTAEEIEQLKYTYKNGRFHIRFGKVMILEPVEDGLRGTLNFRGKAEKLFLKKIK